MDGDAFVRAAFDGDLDAVTTYLDGGGDPNHVTASGWTALNAALQMSVSGDHSGDPRSVVRRLIDRDDVDRSVPSPDGWRPFVKAAAWSAYLYDVLEHLITRGDSWRGPEDWKAINYAASWRGDAGIRLLCANGADPDTRDDEGRTPLMRAVKKGHKASVQALLDAGADPNLAGPDGQTALMIAATKPMVDNVRALLAHGADRRATDAAGRDALTHARAAGRTKNVALLDVPG